MKKPLHEHGEKGRKTLAEMAHECGSDFVNDLYAELPFTQIPGGALSYERHEETDMSKTSDPANPKDSIGSCKAPIHLIPMPILFEMGLAMLEGSLKYGGHNYRVTGVRATVYVNAAVRHLMAFLEGEDVDPDSGLTHLAKAMACCAIIRDSQLMGNWIDDRPPKLPDGLDMPRLNALAKNLMEKYPDTKPAFTEVGRKTNLIEEAITNTLEKMAKDVKVKSLALSHTKSKKEPGILMSHVKDKAVKYKCILPSGGIRCVENPSLRNCGHCKFLEAQND